MPIRGGYVPGEHEIKDIQAQQPGTAIYNLDEEAVAKAAQLQVLSTSLFLKDFINDSLSSLKHAVNHERRKSGKGNVDEKRLEKVKEFMRKKHPQGVRIFEVAKYVGCTQNRAAKLLDTLSEGNDFLVSMDDEIRPSQYYIFKDNISA